MSNILEKLFGSSLRIKLIRLFFLHPEDIFVVPDIIKRTKASSRNTRKELLLLRNIGLIRYAAKTILQGKKKKKKVNGLMLDGSFPFYHALKNFVLNASPTSKTALLRRIKRLGNVRLVIVSGIFIQEDDSRLDILVVGNGIKRGVFEKILSGVEAEVGRELRYALMNTQEFLYRLGMYDKFVRDILDYPHEKLLNKLGI